MNPGKILFLAVVGLLIAIIILLVMLGRTNDPGALGIAMTLVVEVIFFVLAAYATAQPAAPAPAPSNTGSDSGKTQRRLTKMVAIMLLCLAVMVATSALIALFEAYKGQIATLVSAQELTIHTPRANIALQLGFGGYVGVIFWLPAIALASFLIGRVSERITFLDCGIAIFLSIGLIIFANLIVEIIDGVPSVERVLAGLYNQSEGRPERLLGETMFMSLMFIASFLTIWLLLTLLTWLCASCGRRFR